MQIGHRGAVTKMYKQKDFTSGQFCSLSIFSYPSNQLIGLIFFIVKIFLTKDWLYFYKTWMDNALWQSAVSPESSASWAIDNHLNCCVWCSRFASVGMNRLLSWPIFAARSTVLNHQNPVLFWLYDKVYCPFYSQFQRLMLKHLKFSCILLSSHIYLEKIDILSGERTPTRLWTNPWEETTFYRLF